MPSKTGDIRVILALTVFITLGVCFSLSGNGYTQEPWEFALQSGGAVYFAVEPGWLEIDILKKDQIARRDWNQTMRATLVGPNRHVIAETVLPDTPKAHLDLSQEWGPPQHGQIRVNIPIAGVYMLLVTVDQDSYGKSTLWTFTTNAAHYLIDASLGHVDGPRLDEIVLNQPDLPGEICFKPTQPISLITLTGLPASITEVPLLDPSDKEAMRIKVHNGQATGLAIATTPQARDGVWRLILPQQQVRASIEGVTHWKTTTRSLMPLWTTSRERYFDLLPYRWLLTPYRVTHMAAVNDTGSVTFQVFNNDTKPMTIDLSLLTQQEMLATSNGAFTGSQDAEVRFTLEPQQMTLEPQQKQQVTLRYTVTQAITEEAQLHLVAKVADSDFQTYSTLTLIPKSNGGRQLETIQLQPFAHAQGLYGYVPDFPVGTEPYFNRENTPWIIANQQLWQRTSSGWQALQQVSEAITAHYGSTQWQFPAGRVGFDTAGNVYVLAQKDLQPVLVRFDTSSAQVQLVALPGRGGYAVLETFVGHNDTAHPPAILRYTSLGTLRDPQAKWGANHRLELLVPQVVDGQLVVGEPMLISEYCIGIADKAGLTSPVISKGDQSFLIWGETSDRAAGHRGVPTYAATYHRSSRQLSTPALIGFAPPVNDVHNVPSIVIDSKGYLHAILGAHNNPFQYARSTQPYSTAEWGKVEQIAPGYEQTYVGVVVDANDTLHLVSRIWRRGALFPGLFDAAMFYQTKPEGQSWSKPRAFLLPPLPHYSIYYNRLVIDRTGRLFFSYDYWATWQAYRSEIIGQAPAGTGFGRTLLFSTDQGAHWSLVQDNDF